MRMHAILPRAVDTARIARTLAARPGQAEAAARNHPTGRMARPGEIAEAAGRLPSDRASFVTGHMLANDGGLSAVARHQAGRRGPGAGQRRARSAPDTPPASARRFRSARPA
jgi:NAD(P)-dependent dehydrogenase (short-subunit alcohol dehydrogenase family)